MVYSFCSNLMQKLNSAVPLKKPSLASARSVSSIQGSAVKSASIKPAPLVSRHGSATQKHNVPPPKVPTTADEPSRAPALVSCTGLVSPGRSGDFVSIDETISSCDSMKSPVDFEYIDNQYSSMQRRANEHMRISEDRDVEGMMKFILRFAFVSVICYTFLLIQLRMACLLLQKISGRKMPLPQWKLTASVMLIMNMRIHSCALLWLLTFTCTCERLR